MWPFSKMHSNVIIVFISRGNTGSEPAEVGYLDRKKQQCFILSFTYVSSIMVCIGFLTLFKQMIIPSLKDRLIAVPPLNAADEGGAYRYLGRMLCG